MKKFLTLLLALSLSFLVSCGGESGTARFSEDGTVLTCEGQEYRKIDLGKYTYFYPGAYNSYGDNSVEGAGNEDNLYSTIAQDIVVTMPVSPQEQTHLTPLQIYVSQASEGALRDFARCNYASFRLYSPDRKNYVDFSVDPENDDCFSAEVDVTGSVLTDHEYRLVFGFDATGTFYRPLGVIVEGSGNKYYYLSHITRGYDTIFGAGDLVSSGKRVYPGKVFDLQNKKVLEVLFRSTEENGTPTVRTRESLSLALREDSGTIALENLIIGISLSVMVLALLILLWYLLFYRKNPKAALSLQTYLHPFCWIGSLLFALFLQLKERIVALFLACRNTYEKWRKRERPPKKKRPRRSRKGVPGEERELKNLNISLTKEDLTWKPEDLPEDNAEALNRSFCPACGAKCDWTKPTCGACGATLILGDRYKGMVKFEKDRTVHSPDGHVVDLSTVTRSVYLHHYAPKKLKRALNRHAFWFYAIAAEYLLTFFIVFVELMTLLQSFWGASWLLFGALAYLGCAVSYHRNKGLVTTVILSAGTLLWSILCFCSIETLVGIYPVPYIVVSCITYTLPVIAAGFALYRVIQLEQSYRDFMDGKIYQ